LSPLSAAEPELMSKGKIAIVLWIVWVLVLAVRVAGLITGILIDIFVIALLVAAVIATVRLRSSQTEGPVDEGEQVDWEAVKYERLERRQRDE
jgi:fatty acid desaturase